MASPSEVMTSPKGSNPVEAMALKKALEATQACKRVFRALRRFVKPRLGGDVASTRVLSLKTCALRPFEA